MSSGKITIRATTEMQNSLKELAHLRRVSLNQICIELLEAGLPSNNIPLRDHRAMSGTPSPIEQKNERNEFVDQLVSQFLSEGLIAILKTPGYVTAHVLVFSSEAKIPDDIYRGMTVISQALNQVTAEQPPNLMWIQIAQNGEIIWASSEEVRTQLGEQLDKWSAYVV